MRTINDASSAAASVPRELQQMWLRLVRSKWSSIAVIPADPRTSARSISEAFAQMALFYDLGAFDARLTSAEGASLEEGMRVSKEIASSVASGSRVVIAVDYPLQNGGAMPVIMAADAAILLVRLGAAALDSARSIIEVVGRERVIGAITVR